MQRWEPWRVEADDEWLASHSSDTFARVRRIFHPFARTGDAISHSALGGILGGAARNPELNVRGIVAAQVRYAEQQYAYTTTQVDLDVCRRCGNTLEERHRLLLVDCDGGRRSVGAVRACRGCDTESWLLKSHMPSAHRLVAQRAKVVL